MTNQLRFQRPSAAAGRGTRSYAEARDHGLIDAGIRNLVDAMNVDGVMRTLSSSEGRRYGGVDSAAYVTFLSDAPVAGALSQAIDRDAQAVAPRLHYTWRVAGWFQNGALIFDLESSGVSQGFPHRRQQIEDDFGVLRDIVLAVVGGARTGSNGVHRGSAMPDRAARGVALNSAVLRGPAPRITVALGYIQSHFKRVSSSLCVSVTAVALGAMPVSAQTPAPARAPTIVQEATPVIAPSSAPAAAPTPVLAATGTPGDVSPAPTVASGPSPQAPRARRKATRHTATRNSDARRAAADHARPDGPDGTYVAQAEPNDTSLVQYDYDSNYTFPIATVQGQLTHIEFGPDEKILGVYGSQPKRWVTTVSVTQRDMMVMPREAGLSNPMTVITTKRRYELDMKSTASGKFYQRVSWYYADALAGGAMAVQGGMEFPANLDGQRAEVGGRGDDIGASGLAGSGRAENRASVIDLAHANFGWRVEGDAPFAPTQVFDDGRAVYLKIPHLARMPAIFVLDQHGNGNLTSWVAVPNAPDFYRITEIPTYGIQLWRNGQKVNIFNKKGGGCGLFGCKAVDVKNLDDGNGAGS